MWENPLCENTCTVGIFRFLDYPPPKEWKERYSKHVTTASKMPRVAVEACESLVFTRALCGGEG